VIAAGLAMAVCGTACRAVGDTPPAEARPALRVMSFNVRYGTADEGESAWPKRRALLFDTIAAFAPELLGTQEVLAFQCDDRTPSDHYPVTALLR
jgi:endonuclease/exonuclease/phosphatase family metal-dependent hydrolase